MDDNDLQTDPKYVVDFPFKIIPTPKNLAEKKKEIPSTYGCMDFPVQSWSSVLQNLKEKNHGSMDSR